MEAYRDQYATLFNNGRHVAVIGISLDPDTALYTWARDGQFPIVFATDSGGVVGRRFGAWDAKNQLDDRSLFVIAPDGRVSYIAQPFRQLSPQSYTNLAAAVAAVTPHDSSAAK